MSRKRRLPRPAPLPSSAPRRGSLGSGAVPVPRSTGCLPLPEKRQRPLSRSEEGPQQGKRSEAKEALQVELGLGAVSSAAHHGRRMRRHSSVVGVADMVDVVGVEVGAGEAGGGTTPLIASFCFLPMVWRAMRVALAWATWWVRSSTLSGS
jgi:hypothetical protein